jgi:hypothetical protein
MHDTKRETEILHAALEAFRKATGLNIDVQPVEERRYHAPHVRHVDATILIEIPQQEREEVLAYRKQCLAAEIKMEVTPTTIGMLLHKKRDPDQGAWALVTKYVTPNMANYLKNENIQFLDTVGNAYINDPPLYIYTTGRKAKKPRIQEPVTRIYRPAGLRLIFALLCNHGLENKPAREIAERANIALGNVPWILRELKEMGFLIDRGKLGRTLTNKAKLLEHWVTMYPNQLRPKLMIGRFRTNIPHWWENIDLKKYNAQWGGEVAAAMLTKYLQPQNITIYAEGQPNELFVDARFAKDNHGNIEALRKFWGFKDGREIKEIVHPILIYADLLGTGDARNIETGRMIYEHEIDQLIRED